MRNALFLITLLAGIIAGAALTSLSVGSHSNLFVTKMLAWEFSPRVGSSEIDPYTRARLFFEGELPLAAGEGYTLRARTDVAGAPLDRMCRYRVASPLPAARYWTLTLTDPHGRVLANLAQRYSLTSAEILRASDGTFSILIGPDAMAGNWLPTGREQGRFEIMLRLYETPLAATATHIDPRTMPRLEKLGCP